MDWRPASRLRACGDFSGSDSDLVRAGVSGEREEATFHMNSLLEPLLLFGLNLSATTSVPVVPLAPGTPPSFCVPPVRHCGQWGLPYLSQLPPSAAL